MTRYAVGIDLGTTNCAVAYIELKRSERGSVPPVKTFAIPQLIDVGEFGDSPLLPSFTYLPGDHELAPGSIAVPWDPQASLIVGEAAYRQGSRVPSRLVSSAKSWLCNAAVDREAAILPWNAETDVPRISPITASTHYLRHLRDAWNWEIAKDDESARLERQHLVLTAPASFDEAALELTVEAARQAGLEKLTLLEEPQAAFYHWMHDAGGVNLGGLPIGSACVVVDCGGGTSDFSLIAVEEREGRPEFVRLAVGDHLLLGGDNMDMALARHVEQVVSPNRRLDSSQWGALVLNCRHVKERMLGSNPPDNLTVTVVGRGHKVIGGSLRCEVDRETVYRLTLDGFFPECGKEEFPAASARGGLREFGLPYVADPAITRHLAQFLSRHAGAIEELTRGGRSTPDTILFNGGVFNGERCRDRVVDTMRRWYGEEWNPRVLDTSSLDLAVAQGAAYYGWTRATKQGRRIRAGAARSYYVGIGAGDAHDTGKLTVLCVIPHGLQEEEHVRIDSVPLELQIGEPVAFPLYSSTARLHEQAGQVLEVAPGQLAELPALTTVLRGGRRSGSKRVPVQLEARLTEIGTLELHCATTDGNNRWKLQFRARPPSAESEELPESPAALTDTWSREQLQGAEAVLRHAYTDPEERKNPQAAIQLPKRLEEAIGMPRDKWPNAVLRALWETLHSLAADRTSSVEHEWRWCHLAGYCLRPGWGDPIDAYRVEQLWKVIHQGVVAVRSDRAWSEYWVMCRRVSGGLDSARQKQLISRMLPYIQPGKKAPRRVNATELDEIWRAAASLERLEPVTKTRLGEALVAMLKLKPIPRSVLWAITRIGSRVPLYGPTNAVAPKQSAENWVDRLLKISFDDSQTQSEANFAIAQIARSSGDRTRDIDDALRARVLERLRERGAKEHLLRIVAEVTELDLTEESQLLGDALPPGLQLVREGS